MRKSLVSLLLLFTCIFMQGCEVPTADMNKVDDTFTMILETNRAGFENMLSMEGITTDTLVMVLMDCSGSMAGDKIKIAKESVKMFFDKLPDRQPIGLYAFSHAGRGWVLKPQIYSQKQTNDAVDSLQADGNTPLGDAIKDVLDETKIIKSQNKYKNNLIIVVTDGAADSDQVDLMQDSAMNVIREGFYLDVIGYELNDDHILNKFSSRYRNASETTLKTTLLEAVEPPKKK